MNNRSKILVTLVALLFIVSAVLQYRHFVGNKEFLVVNHVSCDPLRESCFISDCDPLIDEDCDTTPFKKITMTASYAPSCTANESCEEPRCFDEDKKCLVVACSVYFLEEGEVCSDSIVQ